MGMLRESPWYNEILTEGQQLGLEEGRVEMALHILKRRFGDLNPDLAYRVRYLRTEQLNQLVDVALEAPALDTVTALLARLARSNGDGATQAGLN